MATEVEIALDRLQCVESEDLLGDEGFLVVLVDDAPRMVLQRKDLDDGESWPLRVEVRSRSQVSVLLFDLDGPDRHDFLGWHVLSRESGPHTDTFSRQGAKYVLHYRTTPKVRTIPVRADAVAVDLIDITCARTEDVTGTDDVVVTGAVLVGDDVHPVLTRASNINDTETNPFEAGDRRVYSGPLPADGTPLHIGLVGLDDDASSDWAQNATRIRETAHSIRRAVEAAVPGPDDGASAKIVDAVLDVVGLLVSLDRRDVLGRLGLDLHQNTIEADPQGQVFHWRLAHDGANYVVRLRVIGRQAS